MTNRHKRRAQEKDKRTKSSEFKHTDYSWLMLIGAIILFSVGFIVWNEFRIPLSRTLVNPEFIDQSRPFEITYGDENAPVTIIEYASITCGSCRNFHQYVIKPLETTYIKNGMVRILYRHFPLDELSLDAALLLSCSSPDIAHSLITTLFSQQDKWVKDDSPKDHLQDYFISVGMSEGDIQRCLGNNQRREALVAEQQKAREALHINSTPTVFINGRLYSGQRRIEDIRRAINFFLKEK